MKSVLISIQPKWCGLIASGKKTVEVRKTRPKIDTPFKVYIYCTQGKDVLAISKYDDKSAFLWDKSDVDKYNADMVRNGKVIGEFVCDEIKRIHCQSIEKEAICAIAVGNGDKEYYDNSCVSYKEAYRYLRNVKKAYGWHISDIVIYDKPKELSEFSVLDDKAIKECKNRERIYVNPDSVNGAWLKGSYICTKGEEDWCSKCKTKPLKRPPQSWCYVEESDTE